MDEHKLRSPNVGELIQLVQGKQRPFAEELGARALNPKTVGILQQARKCCFKEEIFELIPRAGRAAGAEEVIGIP